MSACLNETYNQEPLYSDPSVTPDYESCLKILYENNEAVCRSKLQHDIKGNVFVMKLI